jgi:hypothetical protein
MSTVKRSDQDERHLYTFIHHAIGQQFSHYMFWSRSSACEGVITGERFRLVVVAVTARTSHYAQNGMVMEDAEASDWKTALRLHSHLHVMLVTKLCLPEGVASRSVN